jgi:hypothetical protein
MIDEYDEGHRVRHIRDGLVGTVTGSEQVHGEAAPARMYQVKWDDGSFESRIDPSEITDAPSA